jgi:hypothetical protein
MSDQPSGQSPDQGTYGSSPSTPPWQPPHELPGQDPGWPQPPAKPKRRVLRNVLLSLGVVVVVIIALSVGISIGSKHNAASSPARSSTPASTPSSAAAASSPAGISADGQQYASDMETVFNFGSGVQDSDIATFGQEVCQARQSGTSVSGEVPTARQSWSSTSKGDAIQMIVLAEKDMCPGELGRQTVTYVVTGTPGADITYGPSGTDDQGSVPMSVTAPLRHPQFYAINAQLQGAGQVSCKLKVDGVTISAASASGGYNIAGCEIGQDPVTNSWEDDNAG